MPARGFYHDTIPASLINLSSTDRRFIPARPTRALTFLPKDFAAMTFQRSTLFLLAISATWYTLSTPALAQRDLTNIPDPDPQKQLEQLRVAEGFEIQLFASDPDIAKPIQSNWDTRGRLWVATSSVYPQLEPGEVANDKIVILEDTDGDGRADKSTVFADGLLIPTGVLPAGNGAYVANSTELLYMEDTNGDDVADTREVILSGFGTEDTHHILHTLRHGPAGYIYFNQSIYIHSNIETPWGPRHLDGGGIWRFRPDTLELEVWVRGFVNPWGHRINEWGQQFATDGAFGEGVNYVFPGAAFVTAVGADRILKGLSPGQPKHCGLEILGGEHLPEDYRGTFLANDFRGHRVNRFVIEESQSGYVARQAEDLIWTDHVAFRPIDASMGPDGAIYISDWYNPIIQHGEVDFRDPRRDRTHGRIWRVTRKDTPPLDRVNLMEAAPERLIQGLASTNPWEKRAARQRIHERGEIMLPHLKTALQQLTPNAPAFEQTRLEYLWALQSLGVFDDNLLEAVLTSSDHHARAAAVRVLVDGAKSLGNVAERLSRAIDDEHPQVRLEAINGLRLWNGPDATQRALAALNHPMDGNLDFALALTARETQAQWLPQLADEPDYLGSIRQLVYALNAAARPEVVPPALKLWTAGTLPAEDAAAIAEVIGRFANAEQLALLANEESIADNSRRAPALAALLNAARARNVVPTNLKNLLPLLDDAPEPIRVQVAELIGRAQLEDAPKRLSAMLSDPAVPPAVRAGALAGLAADPRPAALELLTDVARTHTDAGMRIQALAAWARRDTNAAMPAAVDFLAKQATEDQTNQLVSAILGLPKGAEGLTAALKSKSLPPAIAAAALRTASTTSRQSEALAEALRTAGNVAPVMENLSPAELKQLIADIQSLGNPNRGEVVYRQEDLQCIKCHAVGGSGGLIGPDLTSIGATAQPDYLIESLLKPSEKIKEGYHTTTVVRDDGTVVSGVLIRKTEEELVLRDNNGAEITILADLIEEEVISPVSLMPQGLMEKIRRDELVDLLAFLSQLGRPGDFRVGPEPVVRTWRSLNADDKISEKVRANGVAVVSRQPADFPWVERHTMVSGSLPIEGLPPARYFNNQNFRIVQFAVETPEAGAAALHFAEPTGISGYVGESPFEAKNKTEITLPAGRSMITLVIDDRLFLGDNFRVEVHPVAGSPARPRPLHQF